MIPALSRWMLVIAFLSLVGCEKDDVRSYTAPRDDDPGTGSTRVLAAIIPLEDDTWFVKLTGRKDIVEMVQPAFDQVISSLSFPDKPGPKDNSMHWKVPKGWKEDKTNPNRVATLTPEGVGKPEITITKLGPMAAAVKPNVDRWRRLDLGLPAISPRALEQVVSERTVADHKVIVVNLLGPGRSSSATPTMPPHGGAAKGTQRRPAGKAPITYKLPPGWTDAGSTSMLTVASMTVSAGGETARVLVTPLRGSMPGGLLGNVNRWRGEVELPPLSADELRKLTPTTIQVAGIDAKMLDLSGPTNRSLVVWLEHKGTTWFFKMRGPGKLVGAQRGNFASFVQSVQFTGGADE